MQELIYYVDENDKPTGETAPKLEAHNADTRLHAAFSL
jgi:isopentenyldiphosphate isomerase